MKKYRVNTTVSLKHHALLKKHAEKFGTQQRVLEHALECLENNSHQNSELLPEEELWMRYAGVNIACLVQKDFLKTLFETADTEQLKEQINIQKPMEYTIEFYYQRPLNECSLKEVMDGSVITSRMTHWLDTVDYVESDDHYLLNITHSLGLKTSKVLEAAFEGLFKTYGVKFKSTISGTTFFMKIFKK